MSSVYLSGSAQENNLGVDGVSEESRMQALAHDVAAILKQAGITVYMNNPAWSLSQIVADSNAKRPELHLALHSNAGGGSGTETWSYKTQGTKSAEFGKRLQAALVAALGLPNRGVRDATVPGHRWAEVVQTRATAVLTEIFFHDNAGDVARFKERRQAVVEAIAKTVCEWFGVAYPKPQNAAPTKRETSGSVLWKVQVGAFAQRENAERLAAELRSKGYNTMIVEGR